jgi:hypothetical protein
MGKGYVDGAGDNLLNTRSRHIACSIRHRTFIFSVRPNSLKASFKENAQAQTLKGGDPAAGSPTATLLRLHPSL